jgi:hypothetical protein
MIHMYYEIDVDDKSCLHQILIGYTCMLSIGCKPMILITLNMAKTGLKVIKVNCCRLKSLYPLKTLACLEGDHLIMSGQSC